MALKTSTLPRQFKYSGLKLPDPNPEMTVEQVQQLYAATYPEVATASVSGPEAGGNAMVYTFTREIGSKG
jgi:PRTRC genetic system protein C